LWIPAGKKRGPETQNTEGITPCWKGGGLMETDVGPGNQKDATLRESTREKKREMLTLRKKKKKTNYYFEEGNGTPATRQDSVTEKAEERLSQEEKGKEGSSFHPFKPCKKRSSPRYRMKREGTASNEKV